MNLLEYDTHTDAHTDEIARLVRTYLKSNGWRYTSQHPGSYWMWSYDDESTQHVDGETIVTTRTYVVDESTAIRIQRWWELEAQHFNAHDAECPIFETFEWKDCNCIVRKIEAGEADADGAPIESTADA